MKIKAQMAMVLNLDKCLGCHTCSIPCKNAWTTARGSEYMWFNNVETKPGLGYPKLWERRDNALSGWKLGKNGPVLAGGGKLGRLASIFGNTAQPGMEQYYEPWTYDYAHLTTSGPTRHQPQAGSVSAITGLPMTPAAGPNWEGDLAGTHITGLDDPNFAGLQAEALLRFERVFMMHLPRLCEHCLHPACVAACPSGAIYKRDEDGIVLVDQSRCRGWRQCVGACPYKKVYFNWNTHRAEKCLFCYPRVESAQAPLCAQSCPGRIRYVGVMLVDVDAVRQAASQPEPTDLYEAQMKLFLDPHDEAIARQAERDGLPRAWIEAAQQSPVYKLAVQWRVALPLHPEFRTLPMVWYIPPASPLTTQPCDEQQGAEESWAKPDNMRIPLRYLANLFTAGDEAPVRRALEKLMALRRYMRTQRIHSQMQDKQAEPESGLTPAVAEDMYRLLAVAHHNDRYVIPSAHREEAQGEDVEQFKGCTGFTDIHGGLRS